VERRAAQLRSLVFTLFGGDYSVNKTNSLVLILSEGCRQLPGCCGVKAKAWCCVASHPFEAAQGGVWTAKP
jgi:hypothetical protein